MKSWIEALADRGGPLVPAALAFLAERDDGAPFPCGPDGIRRLARLVDDFAHGEDVPGDVDARFVEGAGALLGLLLIEHAGAGAHRARGPAHRVALGRRGFFDPFGAIDAALDAEEPRAALAERVALAEAEARGEGPVARVAVAFEEALAARRPELAIEAQFELALVLTGGIEVDLAQVASTTAGGSPAAVQAAAERVADLVAGKGAVAAEDATWRLLPRPVSAAFLSTLPEGVELAHAHLGHDVYLAFVLEFGDRVRFVRPAELATWAVDVESAIKVGLHNLLQRWAVAGSKSFERQGPLLVLGQGTTFGASFIADRTLHETLARELDEPIVVAVPHRDLLLATSGERPGGVEALRERARDEHARAPHAISAALFEVTPERLIARP